MLKPAFQAACRAAVEELARETADGGPAVLIGTPWVEDGKLYNACALLDDGRIAAIRFKVNLPNYGVFDEKRVFARGPVAGPVTIRGVRVGVPICEDIWLEESEDYENVVECLAETGAEILIVPNGSPYARDKNDLRLSVAVARVTESGLPLVYLNQVGGQDELVFDGASFVLNADLSLAAQLPAFEESITTLRWSKSAAGWRCDGPVAPLLEGDKGDYAACVLGLRDYVRKNGFPGVLLGVSGGIDSALCAAIAVDALGADRVRGVMLPFRFTAQVSLDDAAQARRTRSASATRCCRSPQAVNGFEEILAETVRRPAARHHRREFAGAHPRHAADGDLQQDRRDGGHHRQQVGNVGRLRHALWRHERRLQSDQGHLQDRGVPAVEPAQRMEAGRRARPVGEVIPVNIITRPPTAELRENQTDQDSLPPYDMLDAHPRTAGRARGAAGRRSSPPASIATR